ncbi:MAG: 50S ribosomal protein L23 [Bacteroidia bacterium]|nr:50S ribosomal protein L23 [Bacteroidia bacterium]MDW8347406.1 50S ribosomal protein L23 [Bacteroidia bacterium]
MIIKRFIVTEKSNKQTEKRNIYTFEVDVHANKIEIAKAVENMFNVQVKEVRTLIRMGKKKVRMTKKGISVGRTNRIKIARVQLQEGNSIDIYGTNV